MKITQKRGIAFRSFDFGETELLFEYGALNSRASCSYAYEQIPVEHKYSRTRAWRALWHGFFMLVFGLTIASGMMHFGGPDNFHDGLILFAITAIGVPLFGLCSVFLQAGSAQTVFMTEPKLSILHDKLHDQILDELMHRRREVLKVKYGVIDPEKSVAESSRSFRWLREEGAISEEEYQAAIVQLSQLSEGITKQPDSPSIH